MPSLKDRLRIDLTDAIRTRDELRAATIRMALTAISTEEVAGREARELSDEDVLGVLRREARKRREAAQAYDDAGRPDRADRERGELAVVEGYLPAQLSDAELRQLVQTAIAEAGATNPRQMGAVMKLVTPKVAGRAEGSRIAAQVRAQLATQA